MIKKIFCLHFISLAALLGAPLASDVRAIDSALDRLNNVVAQLKNTSAVDLDIKLNELAVMVLRDPQLRYTSPELGRAEQIGLQQAFNQRLRQRLAVQSGTPLAVALNLRDQELAGTSGLIERQFEGISRQSTGFVTRQLQKAQEGVKGFFQRNLGLTLPLTQAPPLPPRSLTYQPEGDEVAQEAVGRRSARPARASGSTPMPLEDVVLEVEREPELDVMGVDAELDVQRRESGQQDPKVVRWMDEVVELPVDVAAAGVGGFDYTTQEVQDFRRKLLEGEVPVGMQTGRQVMRDSRPHQRSMGFRPPSSPELVSMQSGVAQAQVAEQSRIIEDILLERFRMTTRLRQTMRSMLNKQFKSSLLVKVMAEADEAKRRELVLRYARTGDLGERIQGALHDLEATELEGKPYGYENFDLPTADVAGSVYKDLLKKVNKRAGGRSVLSGAEKDALQASALANTPPEFNPASKLLQDAAKTRYVAERLQKHYAGAAQLTESQKGEAEKFKKDMRFQTMMTGVRRIEDLNLQLFYLASDAYADPAWIRSEVIVQKLGKAAGLPEVSRSVEGLRDRLRTVFAQSGIAKIEDLYRPSQMGRSSFNKLISAAMDDASLQETFRVFAAEAGMSDDVVFEYDGIKRTLPRVQFERLLKKYPTLQAMRDEAEPTTLNVLSEYFRRNPGADRRMGLENLVRLSKSTPVEMQVALHRVEGPESQRRLAAAIAKKMSSQKTFALGSVDHIKMVDMLNRMLSGQFEKVADATKKFEVLEDLRKAVEAGGITGLPEALQRAKARVGVDFSATLSRLPQLEGQAWLRTVLREPQAFSQVLPQTVEQAEKAVQAVEQRRRARATAQKSTVITASGYRALSGYELTRQQQQAQRDQVQAVVARKRKARAVRQQALEAPVPMSLSQRIERGHPASVRERVRYFEGIGQQLPVRAPLTPEQLGYSPGVVQKMKPKLHEALQLSPGYRMGISKPLVPATRR